MAILPVLTIVIPEIIVGQSWLLLLGNNGLLTNLLGDAGISLPSFYGWTGMVFSMTLVYYTYIYLGVLAALRGFDGQLEEAGLSLGTPPLTTKLRVLVPVLLPAVLVNALVVFTLVVGNFALAMLLGSRVPLLSVMTYNTFVSEMGGSPTLQSAMSVVSIAIVAIVVLPEARGRAQGLHHDARPRAGRRAGALVGLDLLHRRRGSGDPGVAAAADHRIRGRLHQDQRAGHALGQLVAGQHAARAARRARTHPELARSLRWRRCWAWLRGAGQLPDHQKRSAYTQALDYIVVLPLTISGTVLGIALVQTFNTGWLVLAGTSAIMVLCYTVRRLPFAVRNASSVLFNIPDSIEEASISLGVSPLMTFFCRAARHEGLDHLGRPADVADHDLRTVGVHRGL